MRTQEVNNQTPEKAPEFVHIPKQVHKDAIVHLFAQSLIYNHLSNSIKFDLVNFMDDPASMAMELMGINMYQINDKFEDGVYKIIAHYADFKSLPQSNVKLKKLGKKVYKAVKIELIKSDRKTFSYE